MEGENLSHGFCGFGTIRKSCSVKFWGSGLHNWWHQGVHESFLHEILQLAKVFSLKKFPLYSSIILCILCGTISVGETSIGVNPKINNMIAAYRAAQFNLIWISDISILSEYTLYGEEKHGSIQPFK